VVEPPTVQETHRLSFHCAKCESAGGVAPTLAFRPVRSSDARLARRSQQREKEQPARPRVARLRPGSSGRGALAGMVTCCASPRRLASSIETMSRPNGRKVT
jgi:hypothetical protein